MQVSYTVAGTQPIESLAKRQRLIGVVHRTSAYYLVLGLENALMLLVSLYIGASFTL